MSTRVGTLQPSQKRRSLWPAAVVLTFVMLTVAVVAFSLDRGSQAPKQNAVRTGISVAGTAANTSSEIRGGITTPEKSGFRGHAPRHGGNATEQAADALGTNTPTEISGGLPMP